jgi:hypothetical protein
MPTPPRQPQSSAGVESRGGASLPLSVLVRAIPGAQVSVTHPFFIQIEPDGNQYHTYSQISLIFEAGDTPANAVRNYLDVLVDHFEWLTEEESSLAPHIRQELNVLRHYLALPE